MASASAGRSSGKGGQRFLRTADKTKTGLLSSRRATSSEMRQNVAANNIMKAKFKQSIQNTKNSRARKTKSNSQLSLI